MTYCVYYKNELGEVERTLILKRVTRNKNKELIQLMEKLTEIYYLNNASIGAIIADDNNWKLMKTVSSMIPVIGESNGFDIERIADDYEQLTKLFFTTTYDEYNEPDYSEGLKPSIIAKLHELNWGEAQKKALRILKQQANQEVEQLLKDETT